MSDTRDPENRAARRAAFVAAASMLKFPGDTKPRSLDCMYEFLAMTNDDFSASQIEAIEAVFLMTLACRVDAKLNKTISDIVDEPGDDDEDTDQSIDS